ncbi:hypothetical protein [Ruegeria lacuscaerulensis]|uniref:hypothetical protein n=1 Tax=Ruegeria lacuscaerulensis TaxID=55218 RepID=UPI00147B2E1E|nr:hypothetical protein [Ruegeria lacuscaerulensis]
MSENGTYQKLLAVNRLMPWRAASVNGLLAVAATLIIIIGSIDRRDGFVNSMAEKHPNIEVVTVKYGQGD